jgi:hypothetical protein
LSPLELRTRFNLMAAKGNYAISLSPDGDANKAVNALSSAGAEAGSLLTDEKKAGARKETKDLWENLYPAVHFAGKAILAEWHRWCNQQKRIDDLEPRLREGANISLLARYEHACVLTRCLVKSEKFKQYQKALDELEIAVVQPSHRIWAQTDPSLRELHDVDAIVSALAKSKPEDTRQQSKPSPPRHMKSQLALRA